MTTQKRTCSTCCSFVLMPIDGGCSNMVTFRVPGRDSRQPLPGDDCDDHQTQRECDAEDKAISLFWQRLALPRLNANFGEEA